jgi:hypothetical protein
MTNEDSETIPGLAGHVHAAEDRIRDRLEATEAAIDSDRNGVTIKLQFRDCTDLDSVLEQVGEVARALNEHDETASVNAGVDTGAAFKHHANYEDDPPMGWVDATFEVDP